MRCEKDLKNIVDLVALGKNTNRRELFKYRCKLLFCSAQYYI